MKSKEYTLARFIVRFPEQDNGMTDEAIKRNVYRAMEAHAENDAVEFLEMKDILKRAKEQANQL